MITMAYLLLCNKLPTESNFGDLRYSWYKVIYSPHYITEFWKKKDSDGVWLIVQLNDNDDNKQFFSCMFGN